MWRGKEGHGFFLCCRFRSLFSSIFQCHGSGMTLALVCDSRTRVFGLDNKTSMDISALRLLGRGLCDGLKWLAI